MRETGLEFAGSHFLHDSAFFSAQKSVDSIDFLEMAFLHAILFKCVRGRIRGSKYDMF